MNNIQNKILRNKYINSWNNLENWSNQASVSKNKAFDDVIECIHKIYKYIDDILNTTDDKQNITIETIGEIERNIYLCELEKKQLQLYKMNYFNILKVIKESLENYSVNIDFFDNIKKFLEEKKKSLTENSGNRLLNIMNEQNDEIVHFDFSDENKGMEKLNKQKTNEIKELIIKHQYLTEIEYQQLENWTNKTCSDILFDSNIDNWSINESQFADKIIGKRNLMFIIEDIEGNKFGGYINSEINKVGTTVSDIIYDANAFVFTLQKNNKYLGMRKFSITEPRNAFIALSNNSSALFKFGNDICVFKKEEKDKSWCKQNSFNYQGLSLVLIGKAMPNNYFTPTRILVFQFTELPE